MADQLGCTIRSHGMVLARLHMYDWIILLLLAVIDGLLNIIEPFHRFVGKDMMTNLRCPLKGNTVPFWAVPVCLDVLILKYVLILLHLFKSSCCFLTVFLIYRYLELYYLGPSFLEFTSKRRIFMICTMAYWVLNVFMIPLVH
jgi:hypothetical protein